MTTRRDFHGHFSFMDRLRNFRQTIIDKTNASPSASINKIEKWKCQPHQQELNVYYLTVCNGDIEESLCGLELLNGRVVELLKKSDTEYKITFKNKQVYKMIKYL